MPKRTSLSFVAQSPDWMPGRLFRHLPENKAWSFVCVALWPWEGGTSLDSVCSSEFKIWGLNGEQVLYSQRTGALKSDCHRFQFRTPNDIPLHSFLFCEKKNSVYLDIFLRLKWEHIGKMASKLYTYQCFVNISPFPLKCLFPFQL